ncbi:hypothetical protein DWG18_14950 [Lysobacter sp. TY2-98]|uniref:hypothetical protein n=1 Tax=Lysobacter sp. TY2-98 TaxID=2290922 RepID=UPI000E209AA4|nr:hypothetical protein [Lysobacter sp. TY2-98]AXK73447.1 hypothetical protein DWG18_14950 [Lysobacter sp. TY2-98]
MARPACLLTALLALAAPLHAGGPSTPQAAIDASSAAMFEGDGPRALAALAAVPDAQWSGKELAYRQCLQGRFGATPPPAPASTSIDDIAVRQVLGSYQRYWWAALREPAQRAKAESGLLAHLRKQLKVDAKAAPTLDDIEPLVEQTLAAHGWHAQLGVTPPLRELMLWHAQETRPFVVPLPDGPQPVDVDLLSDFASYGWSSFARCDRGSNGGWTTDTKLFAVLPLYDGGVDGEDFRVVFLAHEAQHFADKQRFRNLANWELEYRAKLVELAMADTVRERRLHYFLTSQGDDTNAPHNYANRRVIEDLRTRLGASPETVPVAALQAAARAQLQADTQRRLAATPAATSPNATQRM